MEVEIFYTKLPKEYLVKMQYKNKHDFLPAHPFRCLIIGGSGSRKTMLALNLIKKKNVLVLIWFIYVQKT